MIRRKWRQEMLMLMKMACLFSAAFILLSLLIRGHVNWGF